MKCPRCEGSGTCRECGGSGSVECFQCHGKGVTVIELPSGTKKESRCTFCNGRGSVECPRECEACAGKGEITPDFQREQYKKYHPAESRIKEHAATASFILLALNVLVYLACIPGADQHGHNLVYYYTILYAPFVSDGQWWRVLSAVFLHLSFTHFALNCYCLFIICPPIERIIGPFRFLFLYLAAGIAGNILSMLLIPAVPSAGASGALFGIMGAYFGLNLRHRIFHPSSMQQFSGWLLINLFIGFIPGLNINIWAHLGGLAAGFLLSYFIRLKIG